MCYTDYSYKTAERLGAVKANERTGRFVAKQEDGLRQKEINIYTACDRVPRHCAEDPSRRLKKPRVFWNFCFPSVMENVFLTYT